MTIAALAIQICGLVLALVVLPGCPVTTPPSGVRFPITSGFHTILPTREQRILIWGDAPLDEMAAEWLVAHHYSSILRADNGVFRTSQISHDFATRTAALAVAREMKAEMVLFLDREATKEGALIQSHCGPMFSVTVDVRGLLVESEDLVLRGSAYYPHCVDLTDKTVRSLTCQSFATAWGFRPSGQLEIPSSLMCTTGQAAASPIR